MQEKILFWSTHEKHQNKPYHEMQKQTKPESQENNLKEIQTKIKTNHNRKSSKNKGRDRKLTTNQKHTNQENKTNKRKMNKPTPKSGK